MFRLILGGMTAKKEEYLYKLAAEHARLGAHKQIILVPETWSHYAERTLCSLCGDSVAQMCEVLTFSRLANRIMTTFGGIADEVYDEGGQLLLMYRAYTLVQSQLKMYGNERNLVKLLGSFISVTSELKSAGITPSELQEKASLCDGRLNDKLSDLHLIYSAYCSLCERSDPRDTLTRVADTLDEHLDFFTGAQIYIFGFSGFTAQEKRIIKQLIKGADEIYAAFDCLSLDDTSDESVYFKPAKNAWFLYSYAQEQGKRCEIITLPSRTNPEALSFLEKNLFSYDGQVYDTPCENVHLYTARTPYSECEYAAAYIKSILYEGNARLRDFAVLCADPENYRQTLSAVFERYELPIFDGVKSDVTSTPAAVFIDAVLNAVTDGFDSDDIYRWLKTGLTPFDSDSIHILENYTLQYKLTGNAWHREKPWNMNPDGLSVQMDESAKKRLERINEIRTSVREPLVSLHKSLSGNTTGREKATAFFNFLEEMKFADALNSRSERYRSMGELTLADEYGRIWDVICNCFDSFVDTLGDMPMSPALFSELFMMCLSRYDVSVIPSSIDRIHTGDIASVGFHHPKVLIILGMSDGALPKSSALGGILSDTDRTQLENLGVELSDTPALRMAQEQLSLLRACVAPTQTLILSNSETANDGSLCRTSPYLRHIERIFPHCKKESEGEEKTYKLYSSSATLAYAMGRNDPLATSLFDALSDSEYADNLIEKSRPNRETLTDETARDALYGKKLHLNASRVDCWNSCRYRYFSLYGLKLKARKKIAFDAPEVGTFLHYILEHTIKECQTTFNRFGDAPMDDVKAVANRHIDDYIRDYFGNLEDKTARFVYLFSRLKNTVYGLLENLHSEFYHSQFEPTDFELCFGGHSSRDNTLPPISVSLDGDKSAEFSGVVDRVDTYLKDNTLHIRVVDYKSGTKKFSFGDIAMGLGLQMPLYLAALEDTFTEYKELHKEFSPAENISNAGILYMPARLPVISSQNHQSDEEYEDGYLKSMGRSGVVTNDVEILTAMEDRAAVNPKFLPISINKNGALSKTSNVIGDTEFKLLLGCARDALKNAAKGILDGHVEANPVVDSDRKCVCDYCDFRRICNFSEDFDEKRLKKSMKAKEFFDLAENKRKGDEVNG